MAYRGATIVHRNLCSSKYRKSSYGTIRTAACTRTDPCSYPKFSHTCKCHRLSRFFFTEIWFCSSIFSESAPETKIEPNPLGALNALSMQSLVRHECMSTACARTWGEADFFLKKRCKAGISCFSGTAQMPELKKVFSSYQSLRVV
jgi:hypothetical protein